VGLLLLSFVPVVQYPALSANFFFGSALFLLPFIVIGGLAYLSPTKPQVKVYSATRRSFSAMDHSTLFLLTSIYVIFSLYRYLVIGSVLEKGITGARYEEIASGTGTGGIFTAIPLFLSGAPAILLISTLSILNRTGRSKVLSLIMVALGFCVGFLSGGRASFLLNASFVMVFVLVVRPTHGALLGNMVRKIRRRYKYAAIFGFAGMVGFSLYLFVERASLRSSDMALRLILFSQDYNFDVIIPDLPSPWLSAVWLIVVMLYYYFTGAFGYADLYWSDPSHDLLFGGYSFYTFYYLLDKLLGLEISPNLPADLRVFGAYYTLPGTFLVDFGVVGAGLVSVALAIIVLMVVDRALRGARSLELLAAFLLTVLVFAPLFSSFALASGPSLFLLSLGFWVRFSVGRLPSREKVFRGRND
jgi:hypothetical protein